MVESPKIICDDYRLSYGVNDADQGNIWPEWEYDPDLPKLNIINDGTYEITFSKGGACHFEIPKKDELVIKNIMYKSTGRRINIESITYQVNDPQKGLCDYSVWEFYSGTPTTIQFEVEWKNIIPYNSY